jgi:hypothetical protein
MFKIEPENATVHFELGKNYLALKSIKGYSSFERTITLQTNGFGFV